MLPGSRERPYRRGRAPASQQEGRSQSKGPVNGYTPLRRATQKGRAEVVELLKDNDKVKEK